MYDLIMLGIRMQFMPLKKYACQHSVVLHKNLPFEV